MSKELKPVLRIKQRALKENLKRFKIIKTPELKKIKF